jgi:hypothetical protein
MAGFANGTTYVAYYRVSTKAQGHSGLGLEAQRLSVAGLVKGIIVAEFTEVESGKKDKREPASHWPGQTGRGCIGHCQTRPAESECLVHLRAARFRP